MSSSICGVNDDAESAPPPSAAAACAACGGSELKTSVNLVDRWEVNMAPKMATPTEDPISRK